MYIRFKIYIVHLKIYKILKSEFDYDIKEIAISIPLCGYLCRLFKCMWPKDKLQVMPFLK